MPTMKPVATPRSESTRIDFREIGMLVKLAKKR